MTSTLPLTLPTPVADPAFKAGPYHLTLEQVSFFDQNGYLVLRNWIPPELLARLQEAGQAWIEQGLSGKPEELQAWSGDYLFKDPEHKKVMFRVDYLHNKGYPASLELLGCPQVLAVVESLQGSNFTPTYESMVFKQEGDGAVIRWHQDAIHPRRWRIFNLDLYLDASRSGAGALHVIPGTQGEKQAFCAIETDHGWDVPQSIEVEMEPGDVLLHDVMVAHGSPATHGKALRRTIYYEFRAVEQIQAEGPWDQTWIDKRLRLIPVALRAYQKAFPSAAQFDWKIDPRFHPQVSDDDETELRIVHGVHSPGSYCSAGSVPTA